MLGQSKSNIYVSVARGHDQAIEGEHHYRRAQPEWYLSLEPHKHHIPGVPHTKDSEPVHYHAKIDESTGSYSITTYGVKGEPEILGNILVAEHVKSSSDDIHSALKEKLKAGSSNVPSEQTSEDEPEHWIRKALHVLQSQKIVDSFDVGEFMTFAHAYAANRAEHEAPAMVAYPRLNKDHEKKAQKHQFWVSYPMASKVSPRNGFGKYGGLM